MLNVLQLFATKLISCSITASLITEICCRNIEIDTAFSKLMDKFLTDLVSQSNKIILSFLLNILLNFEFSILQF